MVIKSRYGWKFSFILFFFYFDGFPMQKIKKNQGRKGRIMRCEDYWSFL